MMKTQKEIFNQIAVSIIEILPKGEIFNQAVLEIKRLSGNIGYTGYYITSNNEKKWLNIFNLNIDSSYIEDLYLLSQTYPLIHKNWNRATYILFPEGRMEIEYIWDQELQDEVDKYNDKISKSKKNQND